MNLPLGYALLRDRRVSVRSKVTALTIGLAINGLIELLQLPFESVFALLLPFAGAAGDIVIDGAEVVIVPMLVATVLMPYLASPAIVRQLRAEHAHPVSGSNPATAMNDSALRGGTRLARRHELT